MTDRQIIRELELALRPLDRLRSLLGDMWDEYEFDSLSSARQAIVEAIHERQVAC